MHNTIEPSPMNFIPAQWAHPMKPKEIACMTPVVSELIGAWDVSTNGLRLVRDVTILLARTIDGLLVRGGAGNLLIQGGAKIAQFALSLFIYINQKKEENPPLPNFANDWGKARVAKRKLMVKSLTPVKDDCCNIVLGLFRLIPGTELYYQVKYNIQLYNNTEQQTPIADTPEYHFRPPFGPPQFNPPMFYNKQPAYRTLQPAHTPSTTPFNGSLLHCLRNDPSKTQDEQSLDDN